MITISSFQQDAIDYSGKERPKVYYVSINDGPEKAVSKADLIRAIEMNLPERVTEPESEPETDATTFPAMRTGS